MTPRRVSTNRGLAAVAGVLGALALIAGDTPAPGGSGEMTGLELARAIRDEPATLVVLDVRAPETFEEFHVPRARLVEDDHTSLLAEVGAGADVRVIVTGGPDADPRPGWLSLRRAGYTQVFYVPDVLTAWLDDIISPVLSPRAGASARLAWEEQADLSRYFGGFPRIAEPSTETGGSASRLRRAKRRGCAF